MADKKKNTEEFEVSGENVIKKIKELVHEGNVRKISIQNKEGKTLIEMSLTAGVAGTAAVVMLAPMWAAIAAIAALVVKLKLVVERVDKKEKKKELNKL